MRLSFSILITFLVLAVFSAQAQKIGQINMELMNVYILEHAASQMQPITYMADYGIAEQEGALGVVERYKIFDIKKITVEEHDKIFVVQFFCDEKTPCINQIKGNTGTLISSVSYFFNSAEIANGFASKAKEIIEIDFKGIVSTSLLGQAAVAPAPNTRPQPSILPHSQPIVMDQPQVVKKEKNFLALSNDGDDLAVSNGDDRSPFGQKLIQLIIGYTKDQLEGAKGDKQDNAFSSRIKLPMAKKNYIGNYKGQNCFVAEFGTAKDPDELEETFNEIQDMLDEELTQSWEANDRSQDDIYLDAEYSVFHQEYIDTDHPEMPSVSLMIVPDGKRYTLFMRIGSK